MDSSRKEQMKDSSLDSQCQTFWLWNSEEDFFTGDILKTIGLISAIYLDNVLLIYFTFLSYDFVYSDSIFSRVIRSKVFNCF